MTGRPLVAWAGQAVAVGLAWAAAASSSAAQAPPSAAGEDWSTLAVSLGPAVPAASPYGPAWSLTPGAAAAVRTPAWGGTAHVALWAFRADRRAEVPSFLALVPTAGWGAGVELGPVALHLGVELGVIQTRFEGEGGALPDKETEILVGALARADVPLGGRLGAWADVGVRRVAYAEGAALPSLGGGLSLRLNAPAWLRDALTE